MELMAAGLAGHEHDFYKFVVDSTWLGGDVEYSTLNEALPYWLNGLVPLAYGTDDDRLKGQVKSVVDYILEHQADDGWIGPEKTPQTRFIWARTIAFMGLMQYTEAEPSYESKIVDAMHRFSLLMHSMLANNYTGYVNHPGDVFDAFWARSRPQEMMLSMQWLYDKYPQNNSEILIQNMEYLQNKGYDWAAWFSPGGFLTGDLDLVQPNPTDEQFGFEHGVNAGLGLKSLAVMRRYTHNETYLQKTRDGVQWTFQYHGAASGTILADERMSGLSPMRGSELCTAVEVIYSLGYLYRAMGDNSFADRCELAAFNALPVMLFPDWWSHQYMAEPNQPYSRNLSGNPFYDVNTLGQTFGLEPNYPCCTVNHPQGYPKFTAASFVVVNGNGLAHALLSPANVSTTLSSGTNVTVSCDTHYPFGSTLLYTVEASQPFDFYVRLPSWSDASASSITITSPTTANRASVALQPDSLTGLNKITLAAGTSKITYTLAPTIRTESRANDTIAIYYGALLYALPVGEAITTVPARDYKYEQIFPAGYAPPEVHDHRIANTTAWAIAIDPSTLAVQTSNSTTTQSIPSSPLPNPIFTSGGPPTNLTVQACEIDWGYLQGVPANPPLQGSRVCTGPAFEATLAPYGASKLHMAELPTLNLDHS
ncbi:MAG: hypothetical protein M1819_004162 [Sarea resinae]|nr:MAG: hypothetical protein M1819_004162 [Sarea resinae]